MEIHFVNQGSSKIPLILIHAFPVSYTMWQNQIDTLSNQVEIYAIDLPGFGSSPSLREPTGVAAYTHSILKMMDKQGIDKAIFGGCSMGGYIIFELWRQARERCAGMILCDTRAEEDTEQTKQGRMDTIENVRANGLNQLAEGMIGKVFGETTLSNQKEMVESVKQSILDNSPIGVIHALQAMAARPDSVEDLPGISIPVLILVGDEDKVTPPSAAKRMLDQLPNSEMVEITKAGHLSPLEQPEPVNEAIRQYLKKHFQ